MEILCLFICDRMMLWVCNILYMLMFVVVLSNELLLLLKFMVVMWFVCGNFDIVCYGNDVF